GTDRAAAATSPLCIIRITLKQTQIEEEPSRCPTRQDDRHPCSSLWTRTCGEFGERAACERAFSRQLFLNTLLHPHRPMASGPGTPQPPSSMEETQQPISTQPEAAEAEHAAVASQPADTEPEAPPSQQTPPMPNKRRRESLRST
ncbi:hypothetical protein INR49_022912, partial [Caranx melampygus]